MNKENNKLGMGLGALLNTNNKKKSSTNKIDISKIYPNKKQPRKNFEEKEIKELSDSIKNQGLIQPIVVRETSGNMYEIIAGERRWRACQLAGLHSVNCVVMSVDDKSVYELALIENIQRENLNVVEEAKAYKNLIESNGIKNEELSKKIGKSSSHISNLIRILDLDNEIHQMIIDGKISMGHARALIGVPSAVEKAKEILEEAGWKDNNGDGIREKNGKNLIVRHVTKGDYKNRKPAEFYQAQLKEVGIDAVVEAMAYEATARRYADNAYEMARLGYALFDAHDTFYLPFHSSQVEGGGQFNRSRVIDPKIDDLISKGVAETDIEKRYEIYKELQMYVMEQALFLPSYEVTFSHVHYPYVKDLKVDLLGREYFYDVYLDKK